MSILRALSTIVGCIIAGGCLGGGIGLTLGLLAPSYYRMVSRSGASPTFSAHEFGLGLGLTQGMASGAVIGVVVVLAVTVYATFGPSVHASQEQHDR